MISTRQAEVIGFLSEHGEFLHNDSRCASLDETNDIFRAERNEYAISDRRWYQILEERAGLRPLSRYEIHEEEGYRLEQDVDYYKDESLVDLTGRFEDLSDAIIQALDDDETINEDWIVDWLYDNVDVEVFCDHCGERIE